MSKRSKCSLRRRISVNRSNQRRNCTCEPLEIRAMLSTASLVGIDAARTGTWTGAYGSDGYSVIGGDTSLPSYATMSVAGASYYEWEAPGTSDSRALQVSSGSSSHVAACDYSNSGSFAINLDLTDGNTHQIALYLLDEDNQGRSETVQVVDASTEAVLSSTDVASCSGGDYAVFDISGNVAINVINDSGSLNCVFSGIFFDAGPDTTAAATLSAADTTTQGTWTGTYGSDGYDVIDGDSSLPSYVTMDTGGSVAEYNYSWITGNQTLQISPGSSTRVAAVEYSNSGSFSVNLDFTDGNAHQVALYLLDPDSQGRAETVQVADADSGALLSSTNVAAFSGGKYLVYDLSGDVTVNILNDPGSLNCVLSSVFFDPAGNGSVTGTVFNDANFNGAQDPGEAGLSGDTVDVLNSAGSVIATTTTDANGDYAFSALPTGEDLSLTATVPGYLLEGSADGQSQSVDLTAGSPVTANFPELRSLPAPTDLTATAVSDSETDLSWTSNSAGLESGFHVYESIDHSAFGTTPIATVGSGITSTAITGLDSSHDYAFEVTAFDANGNSLPSNMADAAAPGTPTNVVVEVYIQDGEAYAKLTWNPPDPDPVGTTYSVFVSQTQGSFPPPPVVSGLTATTYTYGPYSPSLTLYFAVQADVPLPPPAPAGDYAGSGLGVTPPVVPPPPQSGRVMFYTAFQLSVMAVQPYLGGVDVYENIPAPQFDNSLGTETGAEAQLGYAYSGFIWASGAPFNSALGASIGASVTGVGNQHGTSVTHSGNPYTKSGEETGEQESVPSALDAHLELSFSGGTANTVLMGNLTGFLVVTYTYTTP